MTAPAPPNLPGPPNLELSGKNAALILDDAPLTRAAYGVLAYAFGANGQMCASISRLLLHQAIATPFLAQLQAQLAQWQVSTAAGPGGSDVCALVNNRPLASIEALVAEALERGAELICGGTRAAADVALFPPTILAHVTPAMRIFREEAFGPLLFSRRTTTRLKALWTLLRTLTPKPGF